MTPKWLVDIGKVIRREFRLIRLRPLYFLGSVGTMTVAALFFLTFFTEGLPQDLPVGVVDLDRTSTSRNFRQQLDATQRSRVVDFESFPEARRALERGDINGFVVIPAHFNADVQAFRCPKMGVYVNTKNPFVGGALAYKDLLTMVNLTNGAVQREALRARGVPDERIMARIQPFEDGEVGMPDISGMYFAWDDEEEVTIRGCRGLIGRAQCGSEDWVQRCIWYDTEAGMAGSLSVSTTDLDGLDLTALAEQVYTK